MILETTQASFSDTDGRVLVISEMEVDQETGVVHIVLEEASADDDDPPDDPPVDEADYRAFCDFLANNLRRMGIDPVTGERMTSLEDWYRNFPDDAGRLPEDDDRVDQDE